MLPDPSFIYWGEKYAMAYAMLEYGILNNAGITVITGEIGCGKTTLIRQLLSQLGEDKVVGLLSNTQIAGPDLLRWVLMAFDQPFEQNNTVAAFRDFQKFLIAQYSQGKRCLLIVDEAQNLSIQALEELRMFNNINTDKDCLLQIILTGQPQLRDMLCRPELEQFVQRVASDFHVEPLETPDVARYIKHRLTQAGSPIKLFSRKACDIVAEVSQGIPRKINLLCDTALVYAYARGLKHVTSYTMQAVVADKRRFGALSQTGGEAPVGFSKGAATGGARGSSAPDSVYKSSVRSRGHLLRLARDPSKSE